MISRLTALAVCFAALSAATIAFAANTVTHRETHTAASAGLRVVQLPLVEVIGHRPRETRH